VPGGGVFAAEEGGVGVEDTEDEETGEAEEVVDSCDDWLA